MTTSTEIAKAPRTAQALDGVIARLAAQVGEEADALGRILIATIFPKGKQEITPTKAHVGALCYVALKYGLDPLVRQIYAFPDKYGGIVPIISIDGWLHIMNSHDQFDGIVFEEIENEDGSIKACTATVYRKDRSHPTTVTEHVSECRRNTDPWRDQPRRMIRHRATIQAVRIAFNIAANDPEDGERMPSYTVMPSSQDAGKDTVEAINAEISEVVDGPPRDVDVETGEIVDIPEKKPEPEPDSKPEEEAPQETPARGRKRTRTPRGFALKIQRDEFAKLMDEGVIDEAFVSMALPEEPEPLEEAFAAMTKQDAEGLLVRARAGEFNAPQGKQAAPEAAPEPQTPDPAPPGGEGQGAFDL